MDNYNKTGGNTDEVLMLSMFYKLWNINFSNVVIPEVSFDKCNKRNTCIVHEQMATIVGWHSIVSCRVFPRNFRVKHHLVACTTVK